MEFLLQVLAALKLAEVRLNEAAENDDWLLQTVNYESLLAFKNEIADYIACGVKLDELEEPKKPTPRLPKWTKLNEDKVREIITAIDCGEAYSAIAKRYGVSDTCIADIALGRTWVAVERPNGITRKRKTATFSGRISL